ncbi:MAG TPA: aminotransferase class I/II-fold pyridoxal phosphate-dependent enzyme, partial [Acidimicrobiales bacterium]|nr:aminotransferase class I/II-fold pyridoxal phosphate-dependent enzyme [Acidimicrobiales bacterium]
MSRPVPLRADLAALGGYHSPQVPAGVRLNTNESPFPPPESWRQAVGSALERIDFNRYPDREATELRARLAESYGIGPDEVFCANGSDEVLQCLLLAFGGPGRRALVFEPTYKLHGHIARITGTEVVVAERSADFTIDPDEVRRALKEVRPEIVFLCSPNNPTGRAEPPELIRQVVVAAPGLVVVDEAYGQFSPRSALSLRDDPGLDTSGLAVVRTFSKTWAMAAARLGYLLAGPEVVAGCEAVALPYHL